MGLYSEHFPVLVGFQIIHNSWIIALFSEQPDRLDLDVSHMFLNYSGCDIGVGMLFSRGRLRFSMVFSCRTHSKNARNQWD